jgi:hypothetical protein
MIIDNRSSVKPARPARTAIINMMNIEVINALNAAANALKKVPRAKSNIADSEVQKITNATNDVPPYSIFAEDILSAAEFISASVI